MKYKNEILNSELIEDLFYYNFTYELNWNKSLFFVSNLNNYSKQQTSDQDTLERKHDRFRDLYMIWKEDEDWDHF
ncbi:hypothetical protein GLOIN_2v1791022 [Rhizophagus irregularis DAOM 181602=DAOM 197198]|nr:hypothetical protein RhiirB3_456750 [Rhizophagus irregularis]GET65886.1 hypothetical protein GLOIN_2v1791022 [Rhizophagus irregularis DAOM 181602=DAOM 197198]